MENFKIPLICLVLISCFGVPQGKYVDEHLVTDTDWEFLTRFCWLSEKGTLDYYFELPQEYAGQKILLYYDSEGQWFSIYKKDKTCDEKISVLSVSSNQIINLKVTDIYSGCKAVTRGDKIVYECRGSRYFRSSRERWWYIAVSRCGKDNPKGINLKYKFWMKNGDDGDMLHEEFSADEFYILPMDIAFLVWYCCMVGLSIVCAAKLIARRLFHTTYKLYLVSLAFWTFYLLLMSIQYGTYSENGIEKRGIKVLGHVVAAVSDVVFIVMLLLMASGYTITRGRLSHLETGLLTVFFTTYSIMYSCLLIWEQVYFDPGLVLYLYESPPGYCLITLRLMGWISFFVYTMLTLQKAPSKASFYILFVMFYSFWFWIVPIMILISKYAIPQYMREKIIVGIENTVVLLGHLFFLCLTVPQRANANFPFHVRTTQIRTDGGSNNSLNYFDEHNYQATSEQDLTRNDVVFDMFVVTCRHVNSTRAPASEFQDPPSYSQAMSTSQGNNRTQDVEATEQATGIAKNMEETMSMFQVNNRTQDVETTKQATGIAKNMEETMSMFQVNNRTQDVEATKQPSGIAKNMEETMSMFQVNNRTQDVEATKQATGIAKNMEETMSMFQVNNRTQDVETTKQATGIAKNMEETMSMFQVNNRTQDVETTKQATGIAKNMEETMSMFQVNNRTQDVEATKQATGIENNTEQGAQKMVTCHDVTSSNMAEMAVLSTLPTVLSTLPSLGRYGDPFMAAKANNLPPLQAIGEEPLPPVKRKKKKKKRPIPPAPEMSD